MRPMISVIMPVYNGAKTIRRAIDSILKQTYTNFEFIIINEEVTDDETWTIIQEYKREDSRIIPIQKKGEKKGVAVSLNIGLHIARGKYIARMDHDDYSYADRLLIQLNYMETHQNIVLCGTGFRQITPRGTTVIHKLENPEEIRACLLFDTQFCHPSVMYRRSILIENNLFYNEDCHVEDYPFWMKLVEYGPSTNLPGILLDYYFGFGENVKRDLSFNLDVCRSMRKQYWDKLSIDTRMYSDELFALDIDLQKKVNPYLIIEAFSLLKEIDDANSHSLSYDVNILRQAILSRWNRFVSIFFVPYTDNISLHISESSSGKTGELGIVKSLQEQLAYHFNINEKGVKNYLKQLIMLVKNKAARMRRIVVFGVGENWQRYYDYIEAHSIDIDIARVVDNNEAIWGQVVSNYVVHLPQEILTIEYDMVLITSPKYYDDIYCQLIKEYEIPPEKISWLVV